jgi:hypothetical protein
VQKVERRAFSYMMWLKPAVFASLAGARVGPTLGPRPCRNQGWGPRWPLPYGCLSENPSAMCVQFKLQLRPTVTWSGITSNPQRLQEQSCARSRFVIFAQANYSVGGRRYKVRMRKRAFDDGQRTPAKQPAGQAALCGINFELVFSSDTWFTARPPT